MTAPLGTIEAKVSAPALANGILIALAIPVYRLVLAFGWFHPSAGQTVALTGFGAAVLYVVQIVTGYLSPHTHRPDAAAGSGSVEPAPTFVVLPQAAPTPEPALVVSEPVAAMPPADAYPGTPPAPTPEPAPPAPEPAAPAPVVAPPAVEPTPAGSVQVPPAA